MLNIPLIRQPENSVDCGIACVAMLLQYYGTQVSFEDVKKDIPTFEIGTYVPQLGSYLLKQGFDVELVTLHPGLFTMNDRGLASLVPHFEKLSESAKEKDKKTLQFFIQFLKDGGKVTVKLPDEADVREELDAKRPVGALLTSNMLSGSKPVFNFHFNLITGIDGQHIYVNDPMWDERGGKKKYKITDFFYALYASAYGDLDNASFLKVRPR